LEERKSIEDVLSLNILAQLEAFSCYVVLCAFSDLCQIIPLYSIRPISFDLENAIE